MNHIGRKVLVIGGGPAGVSAAAFALKNEFKDVTILEHENRLGGLHKDVEINGVHYDIGAFFFYNEHCLISLFPELRKILVPVDGSKQLSLTAKFNTDIYPVTLTKYFKENPTVETMYDLAKLFFHRVTRSPRKCKNTDELLSYYMGFFYKKSGLKHYVKRLYNMDPSDVGLEFSSKRMSNVIERVKIKSILKSFVGMRWKNLVRFQIKSGALARPEEGFSRMYDTIEYVLNQQNCKIFYNEGVTQINPGKKEVTTITGKTFSYDYLISSMPLSLFTKMIGVPFKNKLDYRALCSLFYESPHQPVNDCYVLYNFTERGQWKRITFHSAYYNQTNTGVDQQKHYFVVESMPVCAALDKSTADQLDKDFKASFNDTQWEPLFEKATLTGYHLTPHAYPILQKDFDRNEVTQLKEKLKSDGIYLTGRQGEFDYVSSSDSSEAAVTTIQDILRKEAIIC